VSRRALSPSAGALTALASGPDGLRIEGWIASLGRGELDGFEVSLGTRKQRVIDWHARAASGAASDGRSLFRIVTRATARTKTGALVTVIPRLAGRNTSPVFGALDLRLPLPPKRDRAAVAVDFLPKAFRSLNLLVGLARLRRDGSVLDVGCGVGRITYALAHYLSASGRYEGFDTVPRWVEWNRKTISSRLPNFRFRLVEVRNAVYNRRGQADARRLRFPYDDDTFDTALVESVFQHNRVPVVRHYLTEIGRVLRRGGRCVVTSFLLRRGSRAADQRADGLNFIHALDGAWSASARTPEIGIAFEAARFEHWVAEAGLELAEFHRGDWHGNGPGIAYQDVIVLEKPRGRRGRGAPRRRR
jgi:SAM-dependent methyltransferase